MEVDDDFEQKRIKLELHIIAEKWAEQKKEEVSSISTSPDRIKRAF